ncbi:delta-60 repeat domain-containing protein [Xanthomonadaceae bacterium XH05]|nr:delta-60 repeat domain-containing protein [Xanthomonadaceae bacterium XH05]
MAALISWARHNFADTATLSVDIGTATADFPVTNMQSRGLAAEFRSNPGNSLRVLADNLGMTYERRDSSFTPNANYAVHGGLVQPDGKIVIVGAFTAVGGVSRNYVARLNADGSLDTGFNPNAGGAVYAVALQTDGKIVIVGAFTTVGGVARNRVARLNTDGSLDTGYNPNVNNTVSTVALQTDGKIVIGGSFTTVGGVARNRLARLNTDGSLDTGYNPNVNNGVFTIAMLAFNQIVIGGSFTTVGGTVRNRIARLNADGTLVSSFNPNINNDVYSIATLPGGSLAVGGFFTTVGGTARNKIAKLNADGSLDTGFNPNVGDNSVDVIAVLPTGGIVIGGSFTTVGGVARNRLARLEIDGTLDPNFAGLPSMTVVKSLIAHDGAVIVGGNFPAYGNVLRMRVVSDERVRIIGLLGLYQGGGFSGEITVSSRPSLSSDWQVAATFDMLALRESVGGLPASALMVLANPFPASSQVRIHKTHTDNVSFGSARLWIGDALVLPDGIDAGWSMGFRDSGSLDPTDGQQWIESPGVRTRVLSIPLDGARETETVWGFADGASSITNRMSLHALQMECGTTGEVIAVARTGTALWTRHSAVYGHIEQPWQIGHKAGPFWGGALTVIEER